MTRPDESSALERLARAAVLWYWTCVHGAPALDTPEHQDLWDAIEAIVDASMAETPGRVWTRIEPLPDDLSRVAVDGHGVWERWTADVFRRVDGAYMLRTFRELRELGTVREVES